MEKGARSSRDHLLSEQKFVQGLSELGRGDLAILKRNAGNSLAESRNAMWFYRLLDEQQRKQGPELAFLLATLYGLNQRSCTGNFGATMRVLSQHSSASAIERRFLILLDSEFDRDERGLSAGGEAAFRFRQLVKLAASKEVGIDWPSLLFDLRRWSHPGRIVQKKWSDDFFVPVTPAEAVSK